MRKGSGVRAAFLGLNLALLVGLGLLLRQVFAPASAALPRTDLRQYAVEGAAGGPGGVGRLQVVWEQLDRPRPAPEEGAAAPESAPASAALEAAYDLLCVLVDPQDPFRCSAIVGATGGGPQASLGPGDAFGGGTVVGIEVEQEAEGRRARVRVQLTGAVETLELFMPPEPAPGG